MSVDIKKKDSFRFFNKFEREIERTREAVDRGRFDGNKKKPCSKCHNVIRDNESTTLMTSVIIITVTK